MQTPYSSLRSSQEYSDVIDKSRSSKASEREKELGRIKSAQLREAIQPYIIARDKEHIFKDVLPKKSELVIWCEISTEQRALYTEYIRSKDVVDLTSGNVKKSPLVQGESGWGTRSDELKCVIIPMMEIYQYLLYEYNMRPTTRR